MTIAQNLARQRNFMIMRLRGAYQTLSHTGMYFLVEQKDVDQACKRIDKILKQMGAETVVDRRKRKMREFLER